MQIFAGAFAILCLTCFVAGIPVLQKFVGVSIIAKEVPDNQRICKDSAYRRNATDPTCMQFYRCVDFSGNGQFVIFQFTCGPLTFFDEILSDCVLGSELNSMCQTGTQIATSTATTNSTPSTIVPIICNNQTKNEPSCLQPFDSFVTEAAPLDQTVTQTIQTRPPTTQTAPTQPETTEITPVEPTITGTVSDGPTTVTASSCPPLPNTPLSPVITEYCLTTTDPWCDWLSSFSKKAPTLLNE